MYNDYTMFLIGSSGSGKTQLARSIAKYICIGKDKISFGESTGFDAYGSMTKAGRMEDQGCFVWNDAPFSTLQCEQLTKDHLKNLCQVRCSASIPARYGDATFPAGLARIFTMNSGRGNGREDLGYHFDRYNLDHLAAMARRDHNTILNFDSDTLGCLRNCVMFSPSEEEIGFVRTAVQEVSNASYAEEEARRQRYFAAS